MNRHQRLLEEFASFCTLPSPTTFRDLLVAMYCYQQHVDSGIGERTVSEAIAKKWVASIKWPRVHKFKRFNGGEDTPTTSVEFLNGSRSKNAVR